MRMLKNLIATGFCMAIASCATQQSVHDDVKKMQQGPTAKPHKSITNFSDGLRCMDNMMIAYGVQDVSMLVEDLEDRTTKVNAGTKDMLITAVSKMTRRSRAIRLVPFGNDSGNLIAFLNAAGSSSAYNVVPRFDIRGSISQLDTNIVNKQLGASVAADRWGVGGSLSAAGAILGIDLSIVRTNDLSVMPGVTSSNAVVLLRSGKGADADATIKNSGVSFDFSVNKNDATVQALRNLVELASIELMGRLIRVPYWQCLGITEENEEISREMEDWYYSMRAHKELGNYVRARLVSLGVYPRQQQDAMLAVTTGIRTFQRRMGLPENGQVDFELFKLLLSRQSVPVAEAQTVTVPQAGSTQPAGQIVPAKAAATQQKVTADEVLPKLVIVNPDSKKTFVENERVSLLLSVDKSSYVYCYYLNASGKIERFFPNRFESNNLLEPGKVIRLPGQMAFDIIADQPNSRETVQCYASESNVYYDLPKGVIGFDFEPLQVKSLQEVSEAFAKTTGNRNASASYDIVVE